MSMEIVKVGLVICAGLGSTLAARQVTDAWLGPPVQRLTQAQETPAAGAPAGQEGDVPTPVEEMSREEMEAELKRAQQELGEGGKDDELREFRPTRPLPADMPIALPSDI